MPNGKVNQELIQKSVRLPADLVDYVELCEGETFTEKLVGILLDYRDGLSVRGADLKVLRERYDSCSRQLSKLNDIVGDGYSTFIKAARTLTGIREFCSSIGAILEEDDSS